MSSKSIVIKDDKFSWKGVERKDYKTDGHNFKDIHRYTLLSDEHPELNSETGTSKFNRVDTPRLSITVIHTQ